MTNLGAEIKCAIRAVAEACRVARRVQVDLAEIRQMTKDDRSPVTVADFAAQAIVAARLADELGPAPLALVGEESAADLREQGGGDLSRAILSAVRTIRPDYTEARVFDAIDLGNHDATAECYWTLDPVDGTKGFLRGGQYAVSLALIARGEVVLGVLGCANLSPDFSRAFTDPDPVGCIYYAQSGDGAWYLPADDIDAQPQQVHAASKVEMQKLRVCESVEAAHSRQDDTSRVIDYLNARSDPQRLDSQCKYAVVARGQADAYLRLPTRPGYVERIWDHAAGQLVATEAGAIVTDITGRALDFSHGTGLRENRGVVCAAAPVHEAILGAIDALNIGSS